MFVQYLSPNTMITLKKYGYFIFLIPLFLPAISFYLGQGSSYSTFYALLTVIFVFILVPILDLLLGKDPVNADSDQESKLLSDTYYRYLPISCFPLYLICLFSTGFLLISWSELSVLGQICYVFSMGIVGVIIAINVGHELIHKNTKLEQVSGGLLLSLVCYGGFKIEHIYGHHVHVSTPEDASSSRYNQSVYQFLPRAYLYNFINTWSLQKARLKKKGYGLLSLQNELIWYYLFTLTISLLMGGFFSLFGAEFWMGVAFFYIQGFIAFTSLEIINYIEHYGLHRRQDQNGKYERVTIEHSWNSNYFLTSLFLFQLQRHSDHHAFASRRYQVLRHHEESPQLPFGYATMFTIALIPPLWKAIMNPRVEAYYKDDTEALTMS